jgi:serine/threonine protein kinase
MAPPISPSNYKVSTPTRKSADASMRSKVRSPALQKKLNEESIDARAQRLTPDVPELQHLSLSSCSDLFNDNKTDEQESDSKQVKKKIVTPRSPAIHRSPSFRRIRVRTLEAEQYQNEASNERFKRNTDSMLEDAIIAEKLKRRLTSRRELGISRRTVEDSSLSEFIKKSVMETSLDALSVVCPTDEQLCHAANLALNVFIEGVLFNINDESKLKARQIFQESLIREEFYEGDYICRESDIGEKLFIIEEGIVQFIIGDRIAGTAQNGSIFGEVSLIYGTKRYASVKAVTKSVMMWSLDTLSFRRIQALVAREALMASSAKGLATNACTAPTSSRSEKLKEFHKRCSSLSDLQEQSSRFNVDEFDFSSLKKKGIIGQGSFGSVFLVSLREKDANKVKYFALKSMSKGSIVERGNEKRVVIEKNILQELDSIFIISLFGTHQDSSHIYFLTDFIQGGNLMSYMINKDVLSHSECVFFSANIISALIHIHKKGFVHRDLKPENCLIDKHGYLKLCDFGMAKRLPCIVQLPNGGTEVVTLAFTMCGTPEFMAPEFVLSTGYDKSVDIWALGCILVEMHIGRSPFEFKGDLKKTFREVCLIGMGRKTYNRPDAFEKEGMAAAGNIVEGLLSSYQDRIGKADSEDLKAHEYYESIDFELMHRKQISAPYTPNISHASDVSNFTDVSDRSSAEDTAASYEGDISWCKDF